MSEYLVPSQNVLNAERFVVEWRNTSRARVIEEVASSHNETHRVTDLYTFHPDDEKGFYMLDKDNGKTYAKDTIETSSRIGKIEGEILNNLEMWFENNQKGKILWFSPPFSLRKYDDWKLITHEIKQDDTFGKVLHNRVDLFKTQDEKAMRIIHDLFPQTSGITDPENIRSHLFMVEDDFDLQILFDRIKKIDPQSFAKNAGLGKEQLYKRSSYIADLIERRENKRYVAHEMQRLDLLGKHSTSCPPNFSELLSGISSGSDQYGSLEFSCPSCGGTNTRPVGKLISNCQRCGADVTC